MILNSIWVKLRLEFGCDKSICWIRNCPEGNGYCHGRFLYDSSIGNCEWWISIGICIFFVKFWWKNILAHTYGFEDPKVKALLLWKRAFYVWTYLERSYLKNINRKWKFLSSKVFIFMNTYIYFRFDMEKVEFLILV